MIVSAQRELLVGRLTDCATELELLSIVFCRTVIPLVDPYKMDAV